MSSVIEEYKNKCVQEEQLIAAKNMFKEGLPVEVVSRVFPALSNETLIQLQKNISA